MQEFTLEQIGMQVTALQNFFDQVTLIDPLAQAEVDPATLRATGHADAVPVLNADGRGWQPILGEDTGFVFYQNIQVEHRPFVLAATYFLTADLPANDREANALLRLLGQYREEMRRDYVTGVYNRAFLDSTYRKKSGGCCLRRQAGQRGCCPRERVLEPAARGRHSRSRLLPEYRSRYFAAGCRAGPAERCCPPGRRHFPGGERWHPGGKTAGCAA